MSDQKLYTEKYINEVAQILHEEFRLGNPVYKPDEFVERLGGAILEDVGDILVDAFIEKNKSNNSFIIHINKGRPPLRKRFTIAHELGHLFIHKGFMTDEWEKNQIDGNRDSIYYRRLSGTYDKEEREADLFAEAFLMPRQIFIDTAYSNMEKGLINITKVANQFGVSEDVAVSRAKRLHLIVSE